MDDPLSADAGALSAALADGTLTAERLMEATLDRIDDVNPEVNALVSLRDPDDLLDEAWAADQKPRKGWLHGIPIAIKDLVETAGLRTTYGSSLYAEHVPEADDGLVRRLKAAGAIVIGKTNTPEFGLGSHAGSSVFGPTRTPYDTARTAGGSSSGAAAGLATGMLAVADGSDMMGSLRNPAAWNNVWSLRPTWGLVPGEVVGDTFLHALSTLGPMARSPWDLAQLLQVMAVAEPRRPFGRVLPDMGTGADIAAGADIGGSRIGWLADWGGAYPMEPGILDLCETALAQFTALGCTVEPVAPPFDAAALWESWTVLRSFALAAGLRERVRDAVDEVAPQVGWEMDRGLGLSAMAVHAASVTRSQWYAEASELFVRYDALALPSAQVWPFPVEWSWPREIAGHPMDTYHRWMEVVVPASLIGLPALGVPAGFGARGLPMGLQLMGPVGGDVDLLRLGAAYHAQTQWPQRHPPDLIAGL